MKQEDLTEKRIWAMEYALAFYGTDQYPFHNPMEVTEETLKDFEDDDIDIIKFILNNNEHHAIEMFGLIELIMAYKDEGYDKEQFCGMTKIPCEYYNYAYQLMTSYKDKTTEVKRENDSVIDKLKSIMSGYGLSETEPKTQNTTSKGGAKKGGTKQQPFTTNPAPVV